MTITAQYTDTSAVFQLIDAPSSGNAYPATNPSALGVRPVGVYLQADTQNIRFTADGSDPTASVGVLLTAGAVPFYYAAGPLNQLRFIQTTSGSKLNVTYSQNPLVQGPQGFQGSQGGAGAGSQGSQGSPGAGAQGSQGAAGSQGSQGHQGATAIVNTDGDLGTTEYVGVVAPASPVNGDVWIDPGDYGDGVTSAVVVAALGYTPVNPADIGTAASHAASYFATAAQGATADTALQDSGDIATALGFTPANAADIPTAPAQTNQTSSRALNTTYTNSGARPIMVNATARCTTSLLGGNAYAQGKSDGSTPPTTAASGLVGIQAGLAGEDNTFLLSFVVAAGAKYRIDSSATNGSVTLGAWWEVTL